MTTSTDVAILEAARAVAAIIAIGFEGVAAHLTFSECEALATLCATAGQAEAACGLMLEWAELDGDAGFYVSELTAWGIEATGRGTGWQVADAPGPVCTECGEPIDPADMFASDDMCSSCIHDAEWSGA